jgi:hypothetical protein
MILGDFGADFAHSGASRSGVWGGWREFDGFVSFHRVSRETQAGVCEMK